MKFEPVLTKSDFVQRYTAMEFGNSSPTWDSLDHMQEDFGNSFQLLNDPDQLWHIRNRIKGAKTWYNVPGVQLPDAWVKACEQFQPSQLYISAMAPTKLTTIQGEVQRGYNGLEFTFTTVKKPMRNALAEDTRLATGLIAKLLLDAYLNPVSRDWLNVLLDRYPNHVVELSCYSKCWGTLPGYNTVFWEVRSY